MDAAATAASRSDVATSEPGSEPAPEPDPEAAAAVTSWRVVPNVASAVSPVPVPFRVPGDTVTRQLCATVHLQASFANHVHAELVEPAHRAMAPNWNIDTLMLTRHAEQARQRRTIRDLRLLIVFAVLVALGEWIIFTFVTGHLGALAFGLGLVALGVGAYAAAFTIVWWHYTAAHRSAVSVSGVPGYDAVEPPPLSPEEEESLEAAHGANVVLFSGGKSPFVGSGTLLDRWALTVDLGTGTPTPGGGRAVPDRFDALDLHEWMLATLPDSVSPRPTGGHRLYVVGGNAQAVPGLFRSGPVRNDSAAAIRFRRPVASVPVSMIYKYLLDPVAAARAYTYFEINGWDGQVVVTLFLRAVVRQRVLFVEMSVCALRPLIGEFGEVGTIPLGPGVHRLPVLRSVAPRALPLLVGSPGRAIKRARDNRMDAAARADLELTLAQRADVNFSAGPSLREEVSRGSNPSHFGSSDEEMYYRTISRRSLDCLRDYLVSKKLDVSDFDKQHAAILDKTNANAAKIYGGDE
jgi:hypothetical protein